MLSSKIPKPDLKESMRKLSLADQEAVREQIRKSNITGNTGETTANKSVRIQAPNTSTSRHKDKVEDDTVSTTRTAAPKRDRHGVEDDDEGQSITSTTRRDRHGR